MQDNFGKLVRYIEKLIRAYSEVIERGHPGVIEGQNDGAKAQKL